MAASTPTGSDAKPARRSGSRPRGSARREALLEATLRIVANVGADAVTHRRVAAEAGLPLASTTYYFDSKEHLLTAALEFAAERDIARLRETEARYAGRAIDAGDVVAVIAEPDERDHASDRGSLIAAYALLLEAARRPGLRELAGRWTDAYLTTAGELLTRAGSPRPADDARLLLAAVDGLLIEQLASGRRDDPRPELSRLLRALLESR